MKSAIWTSSVMRRVQGAIAVLLGMLALLPVAHPGQVDGLLEKGAELHRQGKHEEAKKLFATTATAGDPAGAYGMGVLYFQGYGVPKDMAQSSRWFNIAAEKGYAPAQYNLGNAYLRGRGVAKDLSQAEYWWRKAAQKGYIRAQYNLGALLHSAGNSPTMREEGIAWLRTSAASGFERSLESLRSIGEPVNYAEIKHVAAREPLRSEARLMTFNPQGFTIHLLSGREPDSAQQFIEEKQLHGVALPFRFIRGSEQWTAVVYGDYGSRREASAMADRLKPKLKGVKPWIRPLADIHASIQQVWSEEEAVVLKGRPE